MKINKNLIGSSWGYFYSLIKAIYTIRGSYNYKPIEFWTRIIPNKILRLNLIVLVFGVCLSQVNARSFGQQIKINRENVPLEQIVRDLEDQSGYVFLYDKKEVSNIKNISVDIENKPFKEALSEILDNTSLSVDFFDNTVVLKKEPHKLINAQSISNEEITSFQQYTISGRIVDAQQEGIPSVSIRLKSSGLTTSTKEDGSFTIKSSSETEILVISCVGYETREVEASGSSVSVVLTFADNVMDDVIINTGYQSISKERVTGAYSIMTSEDIDDKLQPNLATILEGRLAGLTVDQNNEIVVRGVSTLNASKKPLIVIDGYPVEPNVTDDFYRYDDGLFKNINTANVESITVLKDAVAASIYGARAANGVIVITTKKGREGPANFSYRGTMGLAPTPSLHNLNKASTNDYIDAEIDLFNLNPGGYNINTGTGVISRVPYLLRQAYQGDITQEEANREINELRNNDFLSELGKHLYRTGISHQHNLSINGGTEKHTYNVALNLMGVQQNFKDANNSRYTVDLREDWKFNQFITAGLSANLSYATLGSPTINPDRSLTTGDAVGNQTLFNFHPGSYFTPYTTLFDENGNVANLWGQSIRKQTTYGEYQGMKDMSYDFMNDFTRSMASTQNLQARLTGFVRVNFIEGLNGEIGGNWQRGSYKYQMTRDKNAFAVREAYNDSKSISNPANHYLPDGSIVDENRNNNESWTIRGQINFNRSFDNSKHIVTAIAGTEIRKTSIDRVVLATRAGYNEQAGAFTPVNILDYNSSIYGNDMLFGKRINFNTGSYGLSDNRFVSWYGNASYEYDNRYIVSGSMRLDLTNFFGTDPKYRYRPLWSIGGTWKVSNEKFFESDFINQLHIRGSYGINGNISLTQGPYLILSNASYDATAQNMGSSIASPPNDQLRWEKTNTADIGVDLAMFNNWLDLTVDYYMKRSSDVLANETVDQTIGYTSVMQNVGKIDNSGIEITASSKIIESRDFKWRLSSSFSYNKNKIKEYNVTMASVGNYLRSTGTNVAGYPVNGMWGLRFAPLNNVGAAMIYNAKGEPVLSSQAQAEDAYYIGSTTPLFDISLSSKMSYKNIDLSFMVITKLGHYYLRDAFHSRNIQNKHVGERWRKPGDEEFAKVPALTTTNSDWWYSPWVDININKANFARLRDMTLSYNLDNDFVKKMGLNNARVYLQGRNLITLRAPGMDIDPETMINYTGGTNGNVDYSFSTLPLPREFYFGLQIGF